MNVWSVATQLAIWTLIAGSLIVFGWFLVEVIRLARIPPSAGRRRSNDTGTSDRGGT
jgi:hypothetical protein